MIFLSTIPMSIMAFYLTFLSFYHTFWSHRPDFATYIEILSIAPTIVLIFTLFSDNYLLHIIIDLICLFIILMMKKGEKKPLSAASPSQDFHSTFLNVIIVLMTIFSILAVDFHVFPRHLAKRETFGHSLMDLGVGLFVFKSGFLSRTSRNIIDPNQPSNFFHHFTLALSSSSPLLVLGIFRFLLVKYFNYQEHISEYGVHWNFFLTLFFVRFCASFSSLSFPKTTSLQYFLLGSGIICIYQLLLSTFLTPFLISEDRNTLFEMNKEGICSLVGYLALMFLAISFGKLYFRNGAIVFKKRWTSSQSLDWLLSSSFFWLFSWVSDVWIQRASRRLVNLTYVSEIIAFYSTALLCCSLLQKISKWTYPYNFLVSVKMNALILFLLGNILTGVINLSMNTLTISNTNAILILILYLIGICVIAIGLPKKSRK
jgi:glucosaminylphosphatidylinositol acyltransferase